MDLGRGVRWRAKVLKPAFGGLEELVLVGRDREHGCAGERARDGLEWDIEVIDRALAVDARQAARGGVVLRALDQAGIAGEQGGGVQSIGAPEGLDEIEVGRVAGGERCAAERLEREVADEEAQIERGVAEVGGLEIDEEDPRVVADEHVLGAEVGVDEGGELGRGESIEEDLHGGLEVGVDLRDSAIEGIDAEFIEDGGVVESIAVVVGWG